MVHSEVETKAQKHLSWVLVSPPHQTQTHFYFSLNVKMLYWRNCAAGRMGACIWFKLHYVTGRHNVNTNKVTWSVHQPMHTLKLFILKLLKMLWHVSIIRSSSGSCLPDDDRMIETCRSIFKSFNINNLNVCIGWCTDQVIPGTHFC